MFFMAGKRSHSTNTVKRANRHAHVWSKRAKLPNVTMEQHDFLCEDCTHARKRKDGAIYCKRLKTYITAKIIVCRFHRSVLWFMVTQ